MVFSISVRTPTYLRLASRINGFPCPSSVVDSALEIVNAYQRKIIDLEQQILLKPKMKAVRQREPFPHSLGFGVP